MPKWANELYEIGDTVIIVNEYHHHGFDIGDEVEIKEKVEDRYHAKSLTTGAWWWISDTEVKASYEKITLYTCVNGKLLAEQGKRFGAWDKNDKRKFANKYPVFYEFEAKKDAVTIASGDGENNNYPIYLGVDAKPRKFKRADEEGKTLAELKQCVDKFNELHKKLARLQRGYY